MSFIKHSVLILRDIERNQRSVASVELQPTMGRDYSATRLPYKLDSTSRLKKINELKLKKSTLISLQNQKTN
jgi:hypothetical protein